MDTHAANTPLSQSTGSSNQKGRAAATDKPRAQHVLLHGMMELCAGKAGRHILPICLTAGGHAPMVKDIFICFHRLPLLSFGKTAAAQQAAILSHFYYTEGKSRLLLPVLTPKWVMPVGSHGHFLPQHILLELFPCFHIQFSHRFGDVAFDRIGRYIQMLRDFLVGPAPGGQHGHGKLGGG